MSGIIPIPALRDLPGYRAWACTSPPGTVNAQGEVAGGRSGAGRALAEGALGGQAVVGCVGEEGKIRGGGGGGEAGIRQTLK